VGSVDANPEDLAQVDAPSAAPSAGHSAVDEVAADRSDSGEPAQASTSRRRWAVLGLTAGIVVLLDQLTKHWVLNSLQPGESRRLLPGLDLTLTFNSGSAFSFASGGGPVIGLIAIGVVALILYAGRGQRSLWAPFVQGLVVGGAIGNLADRMFRAPGGFMGGHVVDFLRLPHWPVFNVADMAITVGAAILVVLSFTGKLDDPAPRG
jgi:signal peptidase II